jgi:hypothetical protein
MSCAVIANAVSPAEYVAAYMTPFVLAAVLAHPSRATLMTAAAIVSICNIRRELHRPSIFPPTVSSPFKSWVNAID